MTDLRKTVEEAYDLETADAAWLGIFEMACATEDTMAELEALVKSDGLLSTGSKNQTVIHPAVIELRQQRAAFARLLVQLSLNEEDAARAKQGRVARKKWDNR
jgi:Phage terminase, small subunit